ncbi:DUF423 domain-containing protein [Edwardsiella tarda]|uniref:DUF423 domain-containing protein n=1 Tax=Edwardsiella tarda TaxID=636 RepID=UPI0026709D14|nr:DUF423 domain-containing protein [Edwardsiella tarda]WKS80544.1 DUF423 domain-containing protein [Edwardsiella tarda]
MGSRSMIMFAAISGFIFVALGAFGAHVLGNTLGLKEMAWLHTGLQYQAVHTLAILGLAALMMRRSNLWFYWSSALLALGTVLFSGSLYCLALSQLKIWVYITPIGGTCFLVGWVLMLIGALRMGKRAERHE